jgi:hypothetical protein
MVIAMLLSSVALLAAMALSLAVRAARLNAARSPTS